MSVEFPEPSVEPLGLSVEFPEPPGLSVELLEPPVEPPGLAVEPPVEPSGLSVELPEPPVELLVGALAWSVGVGTDVGVAALAVELSGWQAVRAVDSISAARAAPAFRTARDVDLIRGWLSLRCWWSSSVSTVRCGRGSGSAGSPVRLVPAGGPGPGRASAAPDSCNVNDAVVLVSSAPGMI
ncbi:hypothetical protein HMPREF1979_03333 [Actinomyces johnsonii F0542]|uniref:Uncharacterized protein n=1 Tax=Actinomyces johnsonii F0542 TaxID=1321818 RepID=U1RLB0_9ACTO|nr:hypothetical protein HMPREF1979_03333 [Actinomyces johnsonii F0542]